jgi:hypothetical protein
MSTGPDPRAIVSKISKKQRKSLNLAKIQGQIQKSKGSVLTQLSGSFIEKLQK